MFNQKGSSVLAILIVVIIIGFGTGIYYLYPKNTSENLPNTSTSPNIPQSQNSEIQTTGLDTYTDSQNGFSFKYPKGWFSKETPNDQCIGPGIGFFLNNTQPTFKNFCTNGSFNEVLSVSTNYGNLSIQEAKSKLFPSATEITIAGKQALKLTQISYRIFFKDKTNLDFSFYNGGERYSDQIFSTLRFSN